MARVKKEFSLPRDIVHPSLTESVVHFTMTPDDMLDIIQVMPLRAQRPFLHMVKHLFKYRKHWGWLSIERMMEEIGMSHPSVIAGCRNIEEWGFAYIYLHKDNSLKFSKRIFFFPNEENRIRIAALSLLGVRLPADSDNPEKKLFADTYVLEAWLINILGNDIVAAIKDRKRFRTAAYRRFCSGMPKDQAPEVKDFEVLVNGVWLSDWDLRNIIEGHYGYSKDNIPQYPAQSYTQRGRWRMVELHQPEEFVGEKFAVRSPRAKRIWDSLDEGARLTLKTFEDKISYFSFGEREVTIFCRSREVLSLLQSEFKSALEKAIWNVTGQKNIYLAKFITSQKVPLGMSPAPEST